MARVGVQELYRSPRCGDLEREPGTLRVHFFAMETDQRHEALLERIRSALREYIEVRQPGRDEMLLGAPMLIYPLLTEMPGFYVCVDDYDPASTVMTVQYGRIV